MGSKIGARALMEQAGVPVVPGRTPADQTDAGIAAAATAIGFPVLIKASAGGGGKGMRAARDAGTLAEAIPAARREAEAAFGDGTLYVERLIERPRHVEIQIFADDHGNVVHLFERECSIQRRHQKIIEESPSPALTPALRERMGAAAVAAARAAGYRNAGTIEFLLEGDGDAARFYFLEMNTRLQVEHPVTELVTGTDLVRAQLRGRDGASAAVAPGRIWRSAATRSSAASTRRIRRADSCRRPARCRLYREPSGPGIRIDSGVEEGADVPVQYDPDARQADRARRNARRRDRARRGGAPRLPDPRRPHQRRVPDQRARAPRVSRRRRPHRVRRRAPRRSARNAAAVGLVARGRRLRPDAPRGRRRRTRGTPVGRPLVDDLTGWGR